MIRLKRLYAHDFKQLREVELKFPDAGRILVQGKNEAGKSTLFEALFFALFGSPLPTDSGRASIDDLIGYEKSKARVELDVAVRDRHFRITRTLNRGKPNKWELDIIQNGNTQEIRGNKPVNDRLVAELGFDSDALLNTCFVEQKKLEKLEGLSKGQREASLSKLLNLERLLELEEKLKVRGEDEKLLTRMTRRVELADTQEKLPTAEADLQQAEGQLRLIELRAQVLRAVEERRAADALRVQLQTLGTQRGELRIAAGRVDALDKARQGMDTALDRFDFLSQQTERLESLQREREATQTAVRENVPALQARAQNLGRLARHLARLNMIEAARGTATSEMQRLQSAQQELDSHIERGKTLNESITRHEARVAELENKLRAYDVGDALGEWALVACEDLTGAESSSQLDAAARAKENAGARQRREFILLGVLILGLVVASVVVLPALVLYTRSLVITVVVGLVLSLVATAIVLVIAQRLFAISRELARLTEQVGTIQGEANARRTIASSSAAHLEAAQTRLADLGAPIPATPEAAQARRIEIAATLENKTRAELNAERDLEKEKMNYARAQRDEVVKRINDVTPLAASGSAADSQRVIQKCDRILNRWQPHVARRAAELATTPDLESAKEAVRAVESELKSWQTRIEQAKQLDAQIAQAEERTRKTRADIQAQYEAARALLNGTNPAWDNTFTRTIYADVKRQLVEAFEAGGGEQVRTSLNQVEKEFGASEREAKLREKSAQDAVKSARAILGELNSSDALDSEPTLADLEDLAARFDKISLDERPGLDARVKNLHQRVGALRDTRNRLERDLGLQGESVDLNAARDELEKEQKQQEIRKQGTEMVLRARKRIVQKVLPATMDYMRRILPQLTRDRYHDAELDPETYKIRVWDERAGQSGAWKEKNIFSGGTKDQFSLALRLAFALATLPQERGASPGFIFLDEPLGSFDEERAAALLYLLTEGEIGRAFDQIFLISHVRVPENKFTHKLRLENGVVVESNLDT